MEDNRASTKSERKETWEGLVKHLWASEHFLTENLSFQCMARSSHDSPYLVPPSSARRRKSGNWFGLAEIHALQLFRKDIAPVTWFLLLSALSVQAWGTDCVYTGRFLICRLTSYQCRAGLCDSVEGDEPSHYLQPREKQLRRNAWSGDPGDKEAQKRAQKSRCRQRKGDAHKD